jgi:hypothetical protein
MAAILSQYWATYQAQLLAFPGHTVPYVNANVLTLLVALGNVRGGRRRWP